jgi:hypothetical protein
MTANTLDQIQLKQIALSGPPLKHSRRRSFNTFLSTRRNCYIAVTQSTKPRSVSGKVELALSLKFRRWVSGPQSRVNIFK